MTPENSDLCAQASGPKIISGINEQIFVQDTCTP
jgi:hypothetical protein